jgi:hypothetical protein
LIGSYDEEMAKDHVNERLIYTMENLPQDVRLRYRIVHLKGQGRIDIETRDGQPWDSSIISLQQGTASVRQRTASLVFLDEFSIMPEAQAMFGVALAQVQEEGGFTGKLRMCGTMVPDSEMVEMMGNEFPEALAKAWASGWAWHLELERVA